MPSPRHVGQTAADIATKFGGEARYIYADLQALVDLGFLTWAKEKPADKSKVYRLGPALRRHVECYTQVATPSNLSHES